MKSNINNIRASACQLLLYYRTMYRSYSNTIYINNGMLEIMFDYYNVVKALYFCDLVSLDTIIRAYRMYDTIRYKGVIKQCQSDIN